MATITDPIQLIQYNGPALQLSDAYFLGNLQRVGRVSANKLGYTSFLPGSQFNAFTLLEDGQFYILISKADRLPWELPTTEPVVVVPDTSELMLTDPLPL